MDKKLTFVVDRETKNTVRFNEDTKGAPVIGVLYVQKHGLEAIGYKTGDPLVVTVSTKEEK